MMWLQYLDLLLERYKDKPDNFTLSLGHWEQEELNIPEFKAFLSMELGELREIRKCNTKCNTKTNSGAKIYERRKRVD